MAKQKKIRSKQLAITLMSQEELQRQIVLVGINELDAYSGMLEKCRENPAFDHWFAPWVMSLKKEQTEIGTIVFDGLPEKGVARFRMQMNLGYQEENLIAEAIRTISDWAMAQENVYFLETAAEENATILRKALVKAGFAPAGADCYRKEKPKSAWMPIYMCLGVSVGTSIGTASGNLATGMCIGSSVGLLLGAMMDSAERKKRQNLLGESK